MAKPEADPFETIDLGSLDNVSGGRSANAATGSKTNNATLLAVLTEIEASLAALSHNNNNGMQQLFQMWQTMHGVQPTAPTAKVPHPVSPADLLKK